MTITPRALNTSLNDALFLFFSDPLLEGNVPYVYSDGSNGTGIPTIGVGYALLQGTPGQHNWALVNYQADLLRAMPSLTQPQLAALDDKLKQAMKALNGEIDPLTNQVYTNPFYPASDNNNILGWSMTDTQIHTLFNNTISTYQDRVKAWLGNDTIYNSYQGTQEMFALVSLAFNGVLSKSPTLRGDILAGNRAEAWFEIRYGSNKEQSRGVAKRRYYESEMFGLYDNPAAPSLVDAKQAYRMLQLHRDKIMSYEALFGLTPDGVKGTSHPLTGDTRTGLELAQSLGTSVLLLPTQKISTVVESFNPAKPILLADLIVQNPGIPALQDALAADMDTNFTNDRFLSTDIYLGNANTCNLLSVQNDAAGNPVTRDSILIGDSGADVLNGGQGNDVLIGGTGNDYLTGGKGNDLMLGGAGDDTYIINTGDGTDTIEDKLGNNRVILNGKPIGLLIRHGSKGSASHFYLSNHATSPTH